MKKILSIIALATLMAATTTPGMGAEEFPDISIKELKSAIESGNVILIDVNGSTVYRKGHIPGAIDYRVAKDKLPEVLPENKQVMIVAYCGGPECNAYRTAAKTVEKLGYRNIRHLSAGIVGWIQAGEELAKAE